MLLLGTDTETTGLDVFNDRIIEVAAVLWDTDRSMPVRIFSSFIQPGVPVPELITELTGIKQSDVDRWGAEPASVLQEFWAMAKDAAALVGHNSLGFDQPLLLAESARHGVEPSSLPWIDTSVDVPYPEKIKTRKLVHLAAEHNFINTLAHRALSDVLTMLKILSHYDAATVLATSLIPNVKLQAITKKPWEDPAPEGRKEIDKAKARGFRYDGSNKTWVKNVKQNRVAEEMAHGEFAVVEEK